MDTLRLELFFKSHTQLTGQVIPWLCKHKGLTGSRINITNKVWRPCNKRVHHHLKQQQTKDEPILDYVEALSSEIPTTDMCVHYSLKYQRPPRATPQATADRLTAFLQRLAKQQATTSCLVVSGGSKDKPACDTLFALQHLSSSGLDATRVPPIHVAFNPYIPAGPAREDEYCRLRRKLETGLVAGVYLQMGCDMQVCRWLPSLVAVIHKDSDTHRRCKRA